MESEAVTFPEVVYPSSFTGTSYPQVLSFGRQELFLYINVGHVPLYSMLQAVSEIATLGEQQSYSKKWFVCYPSLSLLLLKS